MESPATEITTFSTEKQQWDVSTAGAFYALSGIVMFLVTSLSETLYANYSVHTNTISDLAATTASTSPIEESAGFIWGLFWFLGSYFLFRNTRRRGIFALYLLPGIGVLMAILSPENINVLIHSVGAGLAFIPGGVAVILSYKLILSRLKFLSIALGALSLAAVVLEFGAYYSYAVQQVLGPGGTERIIVYPILSWLMIFGAYLIGEKRVK